MKYFFLGFILFTASVRADFYIQYDDDGNILATVSGNNAPICKDGRKQISFDKPIDLTGKMLDLPAVTNGKKYDSSKDYNSVTKDAPVVPVEEEVIANP